MLALVPLAIIIMLTFLTLQSGFFNRKCVQVNILMGQSNMKGMREIAPLLNHQVTSPNNRYFFVACSKELKKESPIFLTIIWVVQYFSRVGLGFGETMITIIKKLDQ